MTLMRRAANYGAEKTEFPKFPHDSQRHLLAPNDGLTNFQVWKCLPPMYGMAYHWLHRIDALDGVPAMGQVDHISQMSWVLAFVPNQNHNVKASIGAQQWLSTTHLAFPTPITDFQPAKKC